MLEKFNMTRKEVKKELEISQHEDVEPDVDDVDDLFKGLESLEN